MSKRDYLKDTPSEIINFICQYLVNSEISLLKRSCKRLQDVADFTEIHNNTDEKVINPSRILRVFDKVTNLTRFPQLSLVKLTKYTKIDEKKFAKLPVKYLDINQILTKFPRTLIYLRVDIDHETLILRDLPCMRELYISGVHGKIEIDLPNLEKLTFNHCGEEKDCKINAPNLTSFECEVNCGSCMRFNWPCFPKLNTFKAEYGIMQTSLDTISDTVTTLIFGMNFESYDLSRFKRLDKLYSNSATVRNISAPLSTLVGRWHPTLMDIFEHPLKVLHFPKGDVPVDSKWFSRLPLLVDFWVPFMKSIDLPAQLTALRIDNAVNITQKNIEALVNLEVFHIRVNDHIYDLRHMTKLISLCAEKCKKITSKSIIGLRLYNCRVTKH